MTSVRADLPALRIRRGPDAATVVRVIARVVLALGLLIAGFVGYQFGVTSFFAARAQSSLHDSLVERAATVELIATPYTASDSPTAPFDEPDFEFDPSTVPWVDPTAIAPVVAATDDPMITTEPVPLSGGALGRIVIPSAGIDWTFVEGVTRSDLKTGAGHMPGTAMPGQPGNAVISGHRTTYGAPFFHLDQVAPGDPITIETATGTHVYRVVETLVVEPDETWVTGQWKGAWLTLTTCEPVLSAAQRLVVVATLVAGPNAEVILDGS